jgi:hypothetical protein
MNSPGSRTRSQAFYYGSLMAGGFTGALEAFAWGWYAIRFIFHMLGREDFSGIVPLIVCIGVPVFFLLMGGLIWWIVWPYRSQFGTVRGYTIQFLFAELSLIAVLGVSAFVGRYDLDLTGLNMFAMASMVLGIVLYSAPFLVIYLFAPMRRRKKEVVRD